MQGGCLRGTGRMKIMQHMTAPRLLCYLTAVSIAINIAMNLSPGSMFRFVREVVVEGNNARVFFVIGMDKFLEGIGSRGNVMLRFEGFGELEAEDQSDLPFMLYARAVYTLYPLKVHVVSPEVVVNAGADISANPFEPPDEWLCDNSVDKVVTMVKSPEGHIFTRVRHPGKADGD